MKMKKANKIIAIVLLLGMIAITAAASVAMTQVEAATYTELRITGGNSYVLWSFPEWAYSGGKLLWFFGQNLDATKERNWNGYTQHADNYGNYWGQCVSAVKALSKNNLPTSSWVKGRRVIGGCVSPGTVIATFDLSGRYSGHCAIMNAYTADGIQVWDQNWYQMNGMGVFGKHRISVSGSGVTDADNYYVVIVLS